MFDESEKSYCCGKMIKLDFTVCVCDVSFLSLNFLLPYLICCVVDICDMFVYVCLPITSFD